MVIRVGRRSDVCCVSVKIVVGLDCRLRYVEDQLRGCAVEETIVGYARSEEGRREGGKNADSKAPVLSRLPFASGSCVCDREIRLLMQTSTSFATRQTRKGGSEGIARVYNGVASSLHRVLSTSAMLSCRTTEQQRWVQLIVPVVSTKHRRSVL